MGKAKVVITEERWRTMSFDELWALCEGAQREIVNRLSEVDARAILAYHRWYAGQGSEVTP